MNGGHYRGGTRSQAEWLGIPGTVYLFSICLKLELGILSPELSLGILSPELFMDGH